MFFLPWTLVNVLALLIFIIIAYISIFIPEGLLLSKVQILRAIDFYQIVQRLTPTQAVEKVGLPSLVKYLQSIPPDTLEI